MSRVGRQVLDIPSGVKVSVADGKINVTGSKGVLEQPVLSGTSIDQSAEQIVVKRLNESRVARANHGLMRALLGNMVKGVSDGYSKQLEIQGVGYRVTQSGNELKFSLGYSHPSIYKLPDGVSANIEQNIVTVSGHDKQLVGQAAAEIRSLRKPEPYKGKGIRYVGERVIRKSGKSGKEK